MGVINPTLARMQVSEWNRQHPDMWVPWEHVEMFVLSCNAIWFAALPDHEEVERNCFWASKIPCQLIDRLV